MATEKTYYVIDPEGKLTCMKCKVPLQKGKAKFMYLDNGFPVELPASCMFPRNWLLARCFPWRKPWRISDAPAPRRRKAQPLSD